MKQGERKDRKKGTKEGCELDAERARKRLQPNVKQNEGQSGKLGEAEERGVAHKKG
jgi:hypothetical protein